MGFSAARTGDDYHITLIRFAGNKVTDRLALGRVATLQVEQTEIQTTPAPGAAAPRAELRALLVSPSAVSTWITESREMAELLGALLPTEGM